MKDKKNHYINGLRKDMDSAFVDSKTFQSEIIKYGSNKINNGVDYR